MSLAIAAPDRRVSVVLTGSGGSGRFCKLGSQARGGEPAVLLRRGAGSVSFAAPIIQPGLHQHAGLITIKVLAATAVSMISCAAPDNCRLRGRT